MSKQIPNGTYKYLNGLLYNVIGCGRLTSDPSKIVVIYEQLYDSMLRGTTTKLPIGSVWVRDLEEFVIKFEKVD